jgi:hypothetical protein
MDEEEGSVSENGAGNFKMTSMFRITLFGTALQRQVLTQNEPRDQFWKTDESELDVYPQPWRCR